MFRNIRSVAFILLTIFIAAASAQLTESTLQGTVRDGSGQSVSQAKVLAKNESTGESRTGLTTDQGEFTLPGLAPGTYTISIVADGFKTYQTVSQKLSVGQTTQVIAQLQIGDRQETIEVTAAAETTPVATEGRLSDTFERSRITGLPVPQRDVFGLARLSAGATAIPGAASSTKLTNSPVITVNGNRYRGNNYVLDGSMDTNPNNTGEPAIVPSLESVEEAQVQTSNFSSEFGRGNGAVVNLRTRSGSNDLHGRLWEYNRTAALNARNFFAVQKPPQVFNQFGGNVGGRLIKDRTFFFASYEGTRNAVAQPQTFQVETPEYRNWVRQTAPNSIANQLLTKFPAPIPVAGSGGKPYADQVDLTTPQGTIPALGRASFLLRDYIRFDQYLARIDHSFNDGRDKITGRWIAEDQANDGGTSSSRAVLSKAMRGSRGPYDGYFANLNLGEVHVAGRTVNDFRFSFQNIVTTVGNSDATVPEIQIAGMNAPFGDIFLNPTRLRTYEWRETYSFQKGSHLLRVGGEFRRIFKGISLGPASAGTYFFNNLLEFATDKPYQQSLTVNPSTGAPTGYPRSFHLNETGVFLQDDWRVTPRLNVSLGVRHDYFGDASERDGRLSSLVFGPGNSFRERLASAALTRVNRLYTPNKLNFSPRVGLAYDPFGDGKSSIRSGFSIAYQPHHGQSIAGARALPPDAIQGVLQPAVGIGKNILYGIPVPVNSEFAHGLNPQGGVIPNPGEPAIAITGFVVNPDIKTQYSESWFLTLQREFAKSWVAELGYVGTHGVNLERTEDINRFDGDLLDGKLDRINPNFGALLFVTNGVTSSYHAMTMELRHSLSQHFSMQANYRWSKWLDDGSDTSTGQFLDNDQPGKGAQSAGCLTCERGPSMFDIPHRFTVSGVWTPMYFHSHSLLSTLLNDWEISSIVTAQSGRPFSVWNGGSYKAGGDYNGDGGGGAVGGGIYDRPDAPAPGAIPASFSQQDFINGLFDPAVFPKPAAGANGTLGRNTFRGPHQINVDLSVARSFRITENKRVQFRAEAFNAMNHTNLYLPNTDLSLALKADGTFSKSSAFGKSTAAFDARAMQLSARFTF